MASTTITPNKDAVISEFEISAPADRVFRALTQPEELMRWWTTEDSKSELWELDPRPGGRWQCKQRSSSTIVNGSSVFEVKGEIVEIDPPRLLVYTWATNWDPPGSPQSVVRWELTRGGSGTKVKMTHSNLTPDLAGDYYGGWPSVVDLLKKFAEK